MLESKLEKEISFFNGEVLLKEEGIYSMVHHYQHPSKPAKVILIGELHIGTKGYYSSLKPYIDECEIILREGVYKGMPKAKARKYESLVEIFEKDSLQGLMESYRAAFIVTQRMPNFSGYKRAIKFHKNRNSNKWIYSDAARSKERMDKIEKATNKVLVEFHESFTEDKKKEGFIFYSNIVKRYEMGQLNLKDIANIFIYSYGRDVILNKMVDTELATERDKYVVEDLKNKIWKDKRNALKNAGIFYGSGHMMGIRKLMENDEFVHLSSREILAIRY